MTRTSALDQGATLRRSLKLWQVTVSGVGIVIGAGIYVLIGQTAREAGNALWISFALAGVLSALTALSYAELAGMFPTAGAEYEFANRAFNPFCGFIAGWVMVAGNVIAAAAVSIGFGHYLQHFVDVDARVGAAGLLVVLLLIVCSGVQRSIWLSTALVLLQVGGLLIVIAAGAPHLGTHSLVEGGSVSGVLAGAALVFFAFIGFDEIVTLSEETTDAARVIPRALLLALAIAAVLYMAVAVAAVSLVGGEGLAASERPLALVIEHDWGERAGDVVAFIALASTTNTSLLVLTAGSRLLYGMARAGDLPRNLAQVGRRSRAPQLAALVATAVAAAFAMTGDIGLVAAATDFAVYAIFIGVNLALITLRYRQPHTPRPFVAPFAIGRLPITPVLGLLAIAVMLGYLDREAWLIGLLVLATGAASWAIRSPARRTPAR